MQRTNLITLQLIAAQAAYVVENYNNLWPDELRAAIANLQSLMEKLK